MGIMCSLLALSGKQIAAFRGSPGLASDLAEISAIDGPTRQLQARLRQLPPELQRRLEQAQKQLGEAQAGFLAKDPESQAMMARLDESRPAIERLGPFEDVLDLEKNWHVLHFLLTGHADASSAPGDALLTGVPIGRDLGYGPARLHEAAETRAFRDFLAPMNADRLAGRLDFPQLKQAGIYPISEVPDAANAQAWRDDIASVFPRLKTYVETAANKNEGLLVWMY